MVRRKYAVESQLPQNYTLPEFSKLERVFKIFNMTAVPYSKNSALMYLYLI